jgi:hypothetical protein
MVNAKTLCSAVFVGTLSVLSPLAFAQDSVSPQVGTWVIDEEVTGKPGRGFQIDVQNDTLLLYFYGYEETGEGTFWLAAGKLAPGSSELTADLGAYEGGMAFGDPPKDAVYLGPRGQVTLRFSSFVVGEICLPEEPCKDISAFNVGYHDDASQLLGGWIVNAVNDVTGEPTTYTIEFLEVTGSSNPAVVNSVVGDAEVFLDGALRQADVICDWLLSPLSWPFSCRMTLDGEVQRFRLLMLRNALAGEYYDEGGVTIEGELIGFRLLTSSGRVVIPN